VCVRLLRDTPVRRQTRPYGMPDVRKGKAIEVERPQPHLGDPQPGAYRRPQDRQLPNQDRASSNSWDRGEGGEEEERYLRRIPTIRPRIYVKTIKLECRISLSVRSICIVLCYDQ